MKICSKCGDKYELNFFCRDKSTSDGHKSSCKNCAKKYRQLNKDRDKEYRFLNSEKLKNTYIKYRNENIDKLKQKKKEYYLNNIESIKEKARINYNKNRKNKIEYQKEYQRNNKEQRNSYLCERRENDTLFKLITNVRNLIYNSFYYNGYKKNSKTQELLGCSFDEFRLYLENKFEDWMNWDNKGLYNSDFNYGWDIDHIIPISSANNLEDVIKLNHYTNLQPLCSKVNRDIKKDKLENGII